MGAAGSEQAGDGAFFLLADNGADGFTEQFLGGGHVFPALRYLLESGTSAIIGEITAEAQPLQTVQNLLGLGKRQKDGTIIANMYDVMWSERITRLDGLESRIADGPQTEDNSRRDGGPRQFQEEAFRVCRGDV